MPSFTYTRDIPFSTNNPSNDQPIMQTNTNSIDDIIKVDHYSFGSVGNFDGFHKQVTLPVSSVIPTIAGNQGSVYTKTATTATAHTESTLFYSPDTTGNEYQLTRTISTDFATFATNTNYDGVHPTLAGGWTFLPGGLLFQYGFLPNPTNGAVITFPVAFTSFVSSITLGGVRSNTDDKVISVTQGSISLTQFTVILSGSSLPTGLSWMAIGV